MAGWHLELTKRPDGGAIDIDVLKRKSWPGISAEFVRIPGPAVYDFKISQAPNHIALQDLYRTDGETSASGLPSSYSKDLRNKLTFVPNGCALEGWSKIDKGGTIEIIALESIGHGKQHINLAALPPRLEFEDRMLRWALLRFHAILHDPSQDFPGYAETLGELMTFDLHRISTGQPHQQPASYRLSPSQVRLITDYMDGHLAEKTTVAQFAELLSLTRFHFIRAFKNTTGMPPHQFMIRRRVDRASELLADRRLSIADVAAKTGFNSSVQLTRAFRRVVGTTPSAFRRERH